MDLSWAVILAGALVGIAVGLTGMGGGALMTPVMVLLFGVNPTAAVGSDLAASVAMKPVGAAVHHRARTVRWDIVRWLLPTAVPAGFVGAYLVSLLNHGAEFEHRLKLVIGAALLLAVVGTVVRTVLTHRREGGQHHQPTIVRPVPVLLIGLVGGLIVGVTSVGSGSLIIVMLMLVHPRLRANELVGTDLVQAVPLVMAAAVGHLIFGNVQLALAGTILLGAIPGIYVGAKLSTKAPSDVLRAIISVLLFGSGLALWEVSTMVTLLLCGALGVAAFVAIRSRRASLEPVGAPTNHETEKDKTP